MSEQIEILREQRTVEIVLRIRPKAWTAPLRSKNGRMFPNPEYRQWMDAARQLAAIESRRVGLRGYKGPAAVSFLFKIFSNIHHESERHIIRPDRSNLLKAAEDAIKGIVLADDCQIDDGPTKKMWCNRVQEEGVYITILL